MAQIVKLKRTAVSGKIPSISNLQLGELAMNTYDGRIFFEKSSSEESIQEILTTNSHPFAITGSLYLNGAVTASFFKGDGSQLTNLPTDISIAEATTVTASYVDLDDITITHNFDTYNVLVSVYDNDRNLLIPATTSLPTVNTARVTLSGTQSGFVVVAKGGHLISGSQIADNANKLNNQVGSYYLNWNNFNNIPSGIISSSEQIDNLFDIDGLISSSTQVVSSLVNQDVDLGTGDLTGSNLNITSTGSFGRVEATSIDLDRLSLTSTQTTVPPLQLTANSLQDGVGALRIDGSQADIFLNPSTATHTTVTFAVNNDQRLAFGMDNNSDFYITRRTGGSWYDDTLVLDRDTGEVTLGYDLTVNGNINATNGIISGSSQVSYSGLSNIPSGIVSGSTQLSGYISASGGFTANETIIATGTNSVTSSNILALDTTNNYLGINQSSPEVTLHMTGEGAQSAQIRMEQHNDSGDAPDIRTRKSRGTSASPTKNNAGDYIYRQNSERYNGSSYVTVGQLAVDTNSSNADRFQLTLAVSEDGGAVDAAQNQFKIDGNDSGAITFNGAYKFPTSDGSANEVLSTNGSGTLSFTKTTHKETVSGASSYAVTHNLNEQYPIVQCWDTSTSQQVQASDVTSNSANQVTVNFATNFAGVIIVKK